MCFAQSWCPYRRTVVNDGCDCRVCSFQYLLLLSPAAASQSFDDVDALYYLVFDVLCMVLEGKHRVKGDSKDLRVLDGGYVAAGYVDRELQLDFVWRWWHFGHVEVE